MEAILSIRASPTLNEDFLAWQPEKNGIFTVRSAYHLGLKLQQHAELSAASSKFPEGEKPVWRKIWQCNVPEKVRIFAWKAVSNGLATEENKLRRHMKVTGRCKICDQESEDVGHAIYRCPHAKALWEAMAQVWQIPVPAQPQRHHAWLEEFLLSLSEVTCRYILMIAWRAWYCRNEVTHDKPLPGIEGSRRFLCSYVQSLANIRKLSPEEIVKGKQAVAVCEAYPAPASVAFDETEKKWARPPVGAVKLNVDGSFVEQHGTAGAGMILRDSSGHIVLSSCRSLRYCTSALEAELGAFMVGIALALQWSQEPIIVETDNASLVKMVTSTAKDVSHLGHLVAEVKAMVRSGRDIRIVKIPRSQNKASDALARYGRVHDSTNVWIGTGPDEILNFILRDCNTLD